MILLRSNAEKCRIPFFMHLLMMKTAINKAGTVHRKLPASNPFPAVALNK